MGGVGVGCWLAILSLHRGPIQLNDYTMTILIYFSYVFILVSYTKLETNKVMFDKITFMKTNNVLLLRLES